MHLLLKSLNAGLVACALGMLVGVADASAQSGPAEAQRPSFDVPVQCTFEETCFVQQMPDMAAGEAIADPFCGRASYNDHTGTDIRTRRIMDIGVDVPVIAAADGVVVGVRDGMADRLMESEADRRALQGRDCGNGVVLDHGNGWRSFYCHLKQGTVSVDQGDTIKRGESLGAIGLSGRTEFPHLEFLVRKGDVVIDPYTGAALGAGCGRGTQNTLWTAAALETLSHDPTQILDVGLSATPVTRRDLLFRPTDALPKHDAAATLIWVWAANLKAGDRLRMRIVTAEGVFIDHLSDPLDTPKSVYTAYAGRRVAPGSGPWQVEAAIVRGGEVHSYESKRLMR